MSNSCGLFNTNLTIIPKLRIHTSEHFLGVFEPSSCEQNIWTVMERAPSNSHLKPARQYKLV